MNGRVLTTALAALFLVEACGGGPVRSPSPDRPSSEQVARSRVSRCVSPGSRVSLGSRADDRSRVHVPLRADRVRQPLRVCAIDADGTDLIRRRIAPWLDFDPSWSPHGTRIAFRSDEAGTDSEIWPMNADGSDQRRLGRRASRRPGRPTARTSRTRAPARSTPALPAGGLHCTGLSIMNADGSGQHRLPNADGGEYPIGRPMANGSPSTRTSPATTSCTSSTPTARTSWTCRRWARDGRSTGRPTVGPSSSPSGSDRGRPRIRRHLRHASRRARTSAGCDHKLPTRPRGHWTARTSCFGARPVVMNPDGTGVTALPTNVGETSLPDWTE